MQRKVARSDGAQRAANFILMQGDSMSKGGRPSKYNWEAIEGEYRAGVQINDICRKHGIAKKTLQNKVSAELWEVSGGAKAVMKGFEEVSGILGTIEEESPEILPALYDRISTETEFDIMAGRIVTKTLRKLESVVDSGKKLEKVGVGGGIQSFQEVGMMGSDYKEVMEAVYKGKEILKGKEAAGTTVNVQNNNTAIAGVKTLDDFYEEQ